MNASPWFSLDRLGPDVRQLLICFPHAGGGAAQYYRWTRLLPAEIGVVPVRLPGRESRLNELAIHRMDLLIENLGQALHPVLERYPYAFFGHSMGGAVAFELAHALLTRETHQPKHLFVSSCRGPREPRSDEHLHQMPIQQMIDQLLARYRTADTTSPDERALMEMLAATLKNDLQLLETHVHQHAQQLACPVTALGGASDPGVSRQSLDAWSRETTGRFSVRLFPGGHFYLRDQEANVARLIAQKLIGPLTSAEIRE